MNTIFEEHYFNNIRQLFLLKFPNITADQIPNINYIIIHSTQNTENLSSLLSLLTSLELISHQKAFTSKHSNKFKQIISSSNITLRNTELANFLNIITNIFFPNIKLLQPINCNQAIFKFSLTYNKFNPFQFPQLQLAAQHLVKKDLSINFSIYFSSNNIEYNKFLLSSLKFPINA